jgi:hypothetical protein
MGTFANGAYPSWYELWKAALEDGQTVSILISRTPHEKYMMPQWNVGILVGNSGNIPYLTSADTIMVAGLLAEAWKVVENVKKLNNDWAAVDSYVTVVKEAGLG